MEQQWCVLVLMSLSLWVLEKRAIRKIAEIQLWKAAAWKMIKNGETLRSMPWRLP